MTIGGLILAAGEGRRFGGTKQLAELDGRPLLEHALAAVTAVVAARGRARPRRRRDPRGASTCRAPSRSSASDWHEGQSASLRCGLAALDGADAVLVVLGDQPGITAAAIDAVLAAGGDEDAVRATYDGAPSHPVLLRARAARPRRRAARRRGLPRPAGGARGCARSRSAISPIPADIDTREELARR